MAEGKEFPNYIYKIESDVHQTIYVDCVAKVTKHVADHARDTGRYVSAWIPFGKRRIVRCVDEFDMSIEHDHKSNTEICDHTFLIEQIEVI